METSVRLPRKRGPVPKGYMQAHIFLPPHLVDWAKQKDGGLSALVRQLLRDAYTREQRERPPQP